MPSNTMPSKGADIGVMLENVSMLLNEANSVEACWFIRGVADALDTGERGQWHFRADDYHDHYLRGFNSAMLAR